MCHQVGVDLVTTQAERLQDDLTPIQPLSLNIATQHHTPCLCNQSHLLATGCPLSFPSNFHTIMDFSRKLGLCIMCLKYDHLSDYVNEGLLNGLGSWKSSLDQEDDLGLPTQAPYSNSLYEGHRTTVLEVQSTRSQRIAMLPKMQFGAPKSCLKDFSKLLVDRFWDTSTFFQSLLKNSCMQIVRIENIVILEYPSKE